MTLLTENISYLLTRLKKSRKKQNKCRIVIEICEKENYRVTFSSKKLEWHDVCSNQGTLFALLTRELSRRGFLYTDISRLAVVMNSGTFTSSRIAVIYLNMFKLITKTVIGAIHADFFSADVKAREKLWSSIKWNGYILPVYLREPNITRNTKSILP